jgi:CBS domain containing-hemolysin-like protein
MRRRRAKRPHDSESAPVTEQELQIQRGLETLRGMTAREVMTPRVDVAALEDPVRYVDVAGAVRRTGYSHYPVYSDDLDHLLGVLFVKDLFNLGPLGSDQVPPTEEVSRRLREPFVVPESRAALDLLAEMRRARRDFAVVVDEYGGVSGVLTINDLVSELVGDLRDEFDRSAPPPIHRVDDSSWLVDGSAPVDDVRTEVGTPLPDGDYVTLGGFLFDAFGKIPAEGDELSHDGWSFRVTRMDRRRIAKVVVQALPRPEEATGDANGANRTPD